MTTHFNNQQFVDRLSNGLTTINKRTNERNIAIATAVTFGLIIIGFTIYRLQKQPTERTLTEAPVSPVLAQEDSKNQQQINSELTEDHTVQNYDGMTRFNRPTFG